MSRSGARATRNGNSGARFEQNWVVRVRVSTKLDHPLGTLQSRSSVTPRQRLHVLKELDAPRTTVLQSLEVYGGDERL